MTQFKLSEKIISIEIQEETIILLSKNEWVEINWKTSDVSKYPSKAQEFERLFKVPILLKGIVNSDKDNEESLKQETGRRNLPSAADYVYTHTSATALGGVFTTTAYEYTIDTQTEQSAYSWCIKTSPKDFSLSFFITSPLARAVEISY